MIHYNHHTRITASVLGLLLGAAGSINHGIFEVMQGNIPTEGFFIEAIGESHRFWTYGTEGAITLLPNFLLTGIMVLIVSLAVIIWSLRYIHKTHGATVFILLMVTLTLVGGGLGHIILFVPTWCYATRIDKPLSWWKKVLPTGARRFLIRMWKTILILTVLSWVMVMELGIFGFFPRQSDPDVLLNITFGFVLLTVLFTNIAFISSIAYDIDGQEVYEVGN